MKDACVSQSDQPIFVFKEQKSRVELRNTDRVLCTKVHVDGCDITEGIRCDFLLLAKDLEIFIELKGSDVRHAIMLLEASIAQLRDTQRTTRCYVSCSQVPLATLQIQRFQKQFRKNLRAELIIKSSPVIAAF